jgi:hypothetical protein
MRLKDQPKPILFKTELCRSWEEKGSCRYGYIFMYIILTVTGISVNSHILLQSCVLFPVIQNIKLNSARLSSKYPSLKGIELIWLGRFLQLWIPLLFYAFYISYCRTPVPCRFNCLGKGDASLIWLCLLHLLHLAYVMYISILGLFLEFSSFFAFWHGM